MALVEVVLDSGALVLDPDRAVGTVADCLEDARVTGPFDSYLYCVANGRRVLLGHQDTPTITEGHRVVIRGSYIDSVFVSRGNYRHRDRTTWEELREAVSEGWVIGTERYPGVKIWFCSAGRNSRREPERIFVLKID